MSPKPSNIFQKQFMVLQNESKWSRLAVLALYSLQKECKGWYEKYTCICMLLKDRLPLHNLTTSDRTATVWWKNHLFSTLGMWFICTWSNQAKKVFLQTLALWPIQNASGSLLQKVCSKFLCTTLWGVQPKSITKIEHASSFCGHSKCKYRTAIAPRNRRVLTTCSYSSF